MYKNFKLNDKERKEILEQHGKYGYKRPLNESMSDIGEMSHDEMSSQPNLQSAISDMGLTPDEIDALTSSLIDMGRRNFEQTVDSMTSDDSGDVPSEMFEGDEMGDTEFKLRSAIDKIINKGQILATMGILPAAMFAGGGAGVGAGVTALALLLLKDAAWWKRGHEMHKEMDRARKGTENLGVGDYLMGKNDDQINEVNIIPGQKPGAGLQTTSPANNRINNIATMISSIVTKNVPKLVINNPKSKNNNKEWNQFVREFKITPQEITQAVSTLQKFGMKIPQEVMNNPKVFGNIGVSKPQEGGPGPKSNATQQGSKPKVPDWMKKDLSRTPPPTEGPMG